MTLTNEQRSVLVDVIERFEALGNLAFAARVAEVFAAELGNTTPGDEAIDAIIRSGIASFTGRSVAVGTARTFIDRLAGWLLDEGALVSWDGMFDALFDYDDDGIDMADSEPQARLRTDITTVAQVREAILANEVSRA